MGYRDIKLALDTSHNVASDKNSEDYIDTEQTVPGWEKTMPMAVIINVETVNTAATGFTFELVHKTGEPSTGDATISKTVVLAADLTVGSQIVITLPQGPKLLRYIRLYYTRTGGTEDYVFSSYLTPHPAPTY